MPFHHPLNITLLPKAKVDLEDILQYTQQHHGREKSLTYRDALFNAIDLIANNPDIGNHREGLPEGYLAFPTQKHLIVYIIQSETVFVARILHQHVDIHSQHLH